MRGWKLLKEQKTIINESLILKALRSRWGATDKVLGNPVVIAKGLPSLSAKIQISLEGRLGAKKPSPLGYDRVPSCQAESFPCYSSALSQTRPQTPVLSILVQILSVCYYSWCRISQYTILVCLAPLWCTFSHSSSPAEQPFLPHHTPCGDGKLHRWWRLLRKVNQHTAQIQRPWGMHYL